jgi:protein-S-isoprenylcysteine O-methyltransferase Ste14
MAPLRAIYLVWVIWALSWFVAAIWKARSTKVLPLRQELAYRIVVVAGLVLLFFTPRALPDRTLWRLEGGAPWCCVALAALGFAFCWWARLHLGKLWSANVARKQDHRVVDSGPYALVRHPIYTGIIAASLAVFLAHATVLTLTGFLLTALGWWWKARLEEHFLSAQLGEADYAAYAARVPMLIPFFKF